MFLKKMGAANRMSKSLSCPVFARRLLLQLPLAFLVLIIIICSSLRCTASSFEPSVSTITTATSCLGVVSDSKGNIIFPSACKICRVDATNASNVTVITGASCGSGDGTPSVAKFALVAGIAIDDESDIAYITDQGTTNRIRTLDLTTRATSTLSLAFSSPGGIVFTNTINTPQGRLLYVIDNSSTIRRVYLVNTSYVVLTSAFGGSYLAVSSDGLYLYVTASPLGSNDGKLRRLVASNGTVAAVITLEARTIDGGVTFVNAYPASLLSSSSVSQRLFVTDSVGSWVLEYNTLLGNYSATAGNGTQGSSNGLALMSTFRCPIGISWYCNTTAGLCGLLVADYDATYGSIRFVALEPFTTSSNNKSKNAATNTTTFTVPSSSMSKTKSTVSHSSTNTATSKKQSIKISSTPTTTTSWNNSNTQHKTADTWTASWTTSATPSPTTTANRRASFTGATPFLSLSLSTSSTQSPWSSLSLPPRNSGKSHVMSHTIATTPTEMLYSTSDSFWECESAVHQEGVYVSLSSTTDITGNSVSSNSSATISIAVLTSATASTRTANTTVALTTGSLERRLLMEGPTLLANVTLSAAVALPHWAVRNVTLDGSSTLSWTSVGRSPSGAWHALSIAPPSGGWIGADVSLLADRVLTLRVALECGGSPALTAVVTVPAPGLLASLTAQVVAATKASQIAAVLAGSASSGSALGRVMATRSMALCDADETVGGGVVDLGLAPCAANDDGADASNEARSAVISNAVLVCAVGAVIAALALAWAAAARVPPADGLLRAFALPSSLMAVYTAVLPSTSAGATLLAVRLGASSCVWLDALLVVAGFALAVLPVAALTLLWRGQCGTLSPWVCERVQHATRKALLGVVLAKPLPDTNENASIVAVARVCSAYERVTAHAWKWRAAEDSSAAGAALRRAWVVLLEHRALWYAAGDAGAQVAVSSLAVVGGLGSLGSTLCVSCSVAVAVLLAAQCAVIPLFNVYTSLFSSVHVVVTLALTCVSAVAQLLYFSTATTTADTLWLAELSAGCNLAAVGVSAVKTLADLVEILMASRRRLLEIEEAMAAPERTAQGLVLVSAGRENEELAMPAPLNESCARDETKEIEGLRRRHVQNDELPTRFDDGAAETNLLSTPRDRSGASLAPLLAPNHTLSEFTQRDDEDAVVGMRRQSSATMTRFVEARFWNQVTGAAILPAGIGDDISAGLQQSAVEPAGDHLVVDDDDDVRL